MPASSTTVLIKRDSGKSFGDAVLKVAQIYDQEPHLTDEEENKRHLTLGENLEYGVRGVYGPHTVGGVIHGGSGKMLLGPGVQAELGLTNYEIGTNRDNTSYLYTDKLIPEHKNIYGSRAHNWPDCSGFVSFCVQLYLYGTKRFTASVLRNACNSAGVGNYLTNAKYFKSQFKVVGTIGSLGGFENLQRFDILSNPGHTGIFGEMKDGKPWGWDKGNHRKNGIYCNISGMGFKNSTYVVRCVDNPTATGSEYAYSYVAGEIIPEKVINPMNNVIDTHAKNQVNGLENFSDIDEILEDALNEGSFEGFETKTNENGTTTVTGIKITKDSNTYKKFVIKNSEIGLNASGDQMSENFKDSNANSTSGTSASESDFMDMRFTI